MNVNFHVRGPKEPIYICYAFMQAVYSVHTRLTDKMICHIMTLTVCIGLPTDVICIQVV